MPQKCYEKFVSNLFLDVCVAIFAGYSRVEGWRSGHRKIEFTVRDAFDTRHNIR